MYGKVSSNLALQCVSHTFDRPDRLKEGVKKLSANVWVRDVDGPTLAVIVPLVVRALGDRDTTVQRQVVLLVANLFKMVRSPDLAAKHYPLIIPGVTRTYESASFPELRAFAAEAKSSLENSIVGAAENVSDEVDQKQLSEDEKAAFEMLSSLVQKETGAEVSQFTSTSLAWVAFTISHLVKNRDFAEETWNNVYVGPYLRQFMDETKAHALAVEVLKRWIETDRVSISIVLQHAC